MTREQLPEELLLQIFSYLCFHCQKPDDFPNADTRRIRECKATLARLCRTSRRMLVVAQPILYHYYAAGNIPRPGYHAPSDDRLPVFLGTLVRKPFLACHIRALQLAESDLLSTCTPELFCLLGASSKDLGITPPSDILWAIDPRIKPPDYSDSRSSCHRRIHIWLEELAIALTPNAEKLSHYRDNAAKHSFLEQSDLPLPALKSLALRNETRYFLVEMVPLLMRAPNLEALYAVECDVVGIVSEVRDASFVLDEPLSLPRLGKLVVEGLAVAALGRLVGWSAALTDVEFYYRNWCDAKAFLRALLPIKGTLKRLCFGFLPGLQVMSDYTGSYEFTTPEGEYPTITSLLEFTALKELVLDQAALHRRDDDNVDKKRLVRLLPPSIESVHFTYVYKSMYDELLYFSLAIPYNFTQLRRVKIGIAAKLALARKPEIERMRDVGATLAATGVQVEWAWDRNRPDCSTAIPGGTVSMNSTPLPSARHPPRRKSQRREKPRRWNGTGASKE